MSKHRLCLDVGITQTRVWLLEGEVILGRASTMHGIREGAEAVTAAILETIELCLKDACVEERTEIQYVAAAGMVTSELGPLFAPQVQAPAGLDRLAEHVEEHRGISGMPAPVYVVRGLRFGDASAADERDAMRGEEALFMGLLERAELAGGDALMNLGSHWKLILSNPAGEICASYTGIGGELALAVARETILRSLLAEERPARVDLVHLQRGVERSVQYGLGRALFLIRMNSQDEPLATAEAYWQMVGAILGDAVPFVVERLQQSQTGSVAIAGYGPLAEAWANVLQQRGIQSRVLTDVDVEQGFCAGLVAIVDRSMKKAALRRR